MAKHNNKGRSTGEPKHVRLYKWEIECPAYRALHPFSRSLLIEFRHRSNGVNNGEIHMSTREAAKAIGAGRKAAEKALREVQDYGWVKITKKGRFTVRESSRDATEWALTSEPLGNEPATKDYMKWTEEMVAEKQKAVLPRDTLRAPRGHGRPPGKAQNTPDRAPEGHGKDGLSPYDRAPRGHTYSLPGGTRKKPQGIPASLRVSERDRERMMKATLEDVLERLHGQTVKTEISR